MKLGLSHEQQGLIATRAKMARLQQRRNELSAVMKEYDDEMAPLKAEAARLMNGNASERKRYKTVSLQIANLRAARAKYVTEWQAVTAEITALKAVATKQAEEFQQYNRDNVDEAACVRLLFRMVQLMHEMAKSHRVELTEAEQKLLDEAEAELGTRPLGGSIMGRKKLRDIEPGLREAVNYAVVAGIVKS